MSLKMKMNGPQNPLLQGNLTMIARATLIEAAMLNLADQMSEALANDAVYADVGTEGLSQRIMMAFGCLEEVADSYCEAQDEKIEHYDGDDQVEITEEGKDALAQNVVSMSSDRANYDRARGAERAPHFPPGTELQATSFVTSGARLKTFRDGVSDRVTVGDIASELNLDRAIVSILVEDLHPVADFEGEAVYSRKEVCALQPPIMPFVSSADLAEEFELSFEAVHCALFDADVPATGFQNGHPIYDRGVALHALRSGPLKAQIERFEGGSDWRKAKTLFEAVGLNS